MSSLVTVRGTVHNVSMRQAGRPARIIVEIQYSDGVVYLDRCGALCLRLGRSLGEVFRATLPNMEYGELASYVERLTVRFGPKFLRIEQVGPETVARVEKVIEDTWRHVAEVLEVGGRVTRFAMRPYANWPCADAATARRLLKGSGLIDPPESWKAISRSGSDWGSVVTYAVGDRGGHTRRQIEVVEHHVNGPFPEGYRDFFPKHCVQYDVDFCYLERPEGATLKPEAARAFIRECWEKFLAESAAVGQSLEPN